MNTVVQEGCGCVYARTDQGRIAAFRCPLHGGEDVDTHRTLLASDAVSILPWDASLFFHTMLQRLDRQVPTGALDPALLGDAYAAVRADASGEVGPLSDLLAMLARSKILASSNGTWCFTHRWRYDPVTKDYVRAESEPTRPGTPPT